VLAPRFSSNASGVRSFERAPHHKGGGEMGDYQVEAYHAQHFKKEGPLGGSINLGKRFRRETFVWRTKYERGTEPAGKTSFEELGHKEVVRTRDAVKRKQKQGCAREEHRTSEPGCPDRTNLSKDEMRLKGTKADGK